MWFIAQICPAKVSFRVAPHGEIVIDIKKKKIQKKPCRYLGYLLLLDYRKI